MNKIRSGVTTLAALIVALTACGGPFDSTMTQEAAQKHVLDDLTDALTLLPPGTYLTRQTQLDPPVFMGGGSVTSCSNDLSKGVPSQYDAHYLVVFPAGVDSGAAALALLAVYRSRGWPIDSQAKGTLDTVTTPQKFELIVDHSQGFVYLAGQSPCFIPDDQRSSSPTTISRPS